MTVSGFVGRLAVINGRYTERARDNAWVKLKPDGAPDSVVWLPGHKPLHPRWRCMAGTNLLLETEQRLDETHFHDSFHSRAGSWWLTFEEVLTLMRTNEDEEHCDLQMLTGDGRTLCDVDHTNARNCDEAVSFQFCHNYGSTSLVFTLPLKPASQPIAFESLHLPRAQRAHRRSPPQKPPGRIALLSQVRIARLGYCWGDQKNNENFETCRYAPAPHPVPAPLTAH